MSAGSDRFQSPRVEPVCRRRSVSLHLSLMAAHVCPAATALHLHRIPHRQIRHILVSAENRRGTLQEPATQGAGVRQGIPRVAVPLR